MAGDLTDTADVALPDSPLGERASWMLERLAMVHERGIEAVDVTELHCRRIHSQPGDDEHCGWLWERAARRLGPGRVVELHQPSEHQLRLLVEVNPLRRFWLNVFVEDEPPNKLDSWDTAPALPADVEIRRLEPGDADALARLEREAPMVLGDTTVRFEHDDEPSYLDASALRKDTTGVVSTERGEVIASLQVSMVPMRIGGRIFNINYSHRIRTHPDKLGYGLIKQMSDFGVRQPPVGTPMDGILAAIDVRNEAMLMNGWINRPGQWPNPPVRFVFDAAELASGSTAATPCAWEDRAGDIVEILNVAHNDDEGYVPYTVETLAERVARAPELYGRDDVYANEHAVLGVWESGKTVRTIVTTPTGESVQRRAVIADWGVRPGEDGGLEQLLRQVAAAVILRGMTHLALYTSPRTPAFETLSKLASGRDDFHLWTPPIFPRDDAEERGSYVDALAF